MIIIELIQKKIHKKMKQKYIKLVRLKNSEKIDIDVLFSRDATEAAGNPSVWWRVGGWNLSQPIRRPQGKI